MTAVDAAGNASVSSGALNVTIDTVAPVLATAPDFASDDSGVSNSDDITNVARPTLDVAVAEAGNVHVVVDGADSGAIPMNALGVASWIPTLPPRSARSYSPRVQIHTE